MTIRVSTGLRNAIMNNQGLIEALAKCVIEIRSGPQPASADAAESGTLLGTVTINGDAFTPGSPTNGLDFELSTTVAGLIQKPNSAVWRFSGVAAGAPGHYRLKGNAFDAGASSTTEIRIDGSVGTSGADLVIPSSTSIIVGTPVSIDRFEFQLPASA